MSAAKADCEVLVKQIVQDKRVADEQEKQVNAEAEKIGKEAAEANEIARVVQGELDKALPALQVFRPFCGRPSTLAFGSLERATLELAMRTG